MTGRPITIEGYAAPARQPNPGPAPMQQWLEIALLVVDPSYQRPIRRDGARNVAKIAAEFEWSKFAPVIVAPLAGGLYAIVDGQHRTTAAALIGLKTVPCHIIQADAGKQAEAFAAINGVVTAIGLQTLWHAKLAAGDPSALILASILADVGVAITRYPVPADKMKPGETNAVRALERALRRYGSDTLAAALRCALAAGDDRISMLRAAVIVAICETLHAHHYWREAGERLLDAFRSMRLVRIWDEEILQRAGDEKLEQRLQKRIRRHLTLALGTAAVPAAQHLPATE